MSLNPLYRVSVVIPCFNHARFLSQAIESVLAQSLPAAEILVVDDGSTDDTRAVAMQYPPPVRYIYQENGGLSAARNTGIRNTSGDFIGFLDADDRWLPEFIETLLPMLQENPSLGAVYGGCQFVDLRGNPLPQRTERVVPANRVFDALIDGDFFPAHAVLVRRGCFDTVGLFDEDLRSNEDWDMWLRIASQYPIAGTTRLVALYRMHGNNMSRDLDRMLQTHLMVARKHFGDPYGDPASWSIARQRAYAGIYLWQALAHYSQAKVDIGSQFVGRMLTTSPGVADRVDVFYSLACASQPLGYMGDLTRIDLDRSATWLRSALAAVFADPATPAWLWQNARRVYGTAYFALGLVGYNGGDLTSARQWLWNAVRLRPELVANRRWWVTFVKSLLGNRVLHPLKRIARRRFAHG